MLLCAKIVNTHGVRGEVKAVYFADDISFFEGIDTLYLEKEKPLTVISLRPHKGAVIIKFKEINDMDAAGALRGKELYAKREDATDLPKGRYYIVDIIGLDVITINGSNIGKVCDVIQTGSNDVYIVKNQNGEEHLIPVIDDVVNDIDIKAGKITITPMKGLLNDED